MLLLPNGLGAGSPAGVEEHVQTDIGFSRHLGDLACLLGRFPVGDTGLPTPGLNGALVRLGANPTSATEVPPSEGNEVRRDGRLEVVAPS